MSKKLMELLESDYEIFYSKFVDGELHGDEMRCLCPVHNDTKNSFFANIVSGKWCCRTCNAAGNSPISFYQWIKGVDKLDAIDEVSAIMGLSPSTSVNPHKGLDRLLASPEGLSYLKDRGIDQETVVDFELGIDHDRIAIPIYDLGGNLRVIKKHLMGEATQEKPKAYFDISKLGTRLFNLNRHRSSNIFYLFEGELDCILAHQLGLPAITVTTGAGSWNKLFNRYFAHKKVIICYDPDEAGINGSKKVAQSLSDVTDEIYIITLPEKDDFTDYIKKYGFEEFEKLQQKKFVRLQGKELDKVVTEVHLSETNNSELYKRRVKTIATITGKGDAFDVPKKCTLSCKNVNSNDKLCPFCPVAFRNGSYEYTFKKDDTNLLGLFDLKDSERDARLRALLKCPKCDNLEIDIDAVYRVQCLVLIPEIEFTEDAQQSFVSRNVYFIADDLLEVNKAYKFEGIVCSTPKQQLSTILVYSAEATRDGIDQFQITPGLGDLLDVYRTSNLEECQALLRKKYKDYSLVTSILGRNNLFFAVDLIFHSALRFKFLGRSVQRGHVNGLIFGDTRTGKSYTVDHLIEHFKAGGKIGAENLSFAGLVGGLTQANGIWFVNWGELVRSNRRLVKIDEFHEMDSTDIKKLSETLSSGIASIQKIRSEKAMARTRMIFIANCKNGHNLDNHQFGVEAIPPLFGGHSEDIARLDFAIAISNQDVKPFEITDKEQLTFDMPKIFTSDRCHSLIMWAWSRKSEHIKFSKEAELAILEYAEQQAQKYHFSIPLVPSVEQTIKLARLSVACAISFFSTDETCELVLVEKYHVDLVHQFLEEIYCSQAMQFDIYSIRKYSKDRLKNKKAIEALKIDEQVCDILLSSEVITRSLIEIMFGEDNVRANAILGVLLSSNAIVDHRAGSQFKKTPAFIKYLSETKFPPKKARKF